MKPSRTHLQAAVVLSSVLLAGGFVAYRAGAFPWLKRSSPAAPEREVMGSSKYKAIITPDPATPSDPAIMYSSKSIAPLVVQPAPDKTATPSAASQPAKPNQ